MSHVSHVLDKLSLMAVEALRCFHSVQTARASGHTQDTAPRTAFLAAEQSRS